MWSRRRTLAPLPSSRAALWVMGPYLYALGGRRTGEEDEEDGTERPSLIRQRLSGGGSWEGVQTEGRGPGEGAECVAVVDDEEEGGGVWVVQSAGRGWRLVMGRGGRPMRWEKLGLGFEGGQARAAVVVGGGQQGSSSRLMVVAAGEEEGEEESVWAYEVGSRRWRQTGSGVRGVQSAGQAVEQEQEEEGGQRRRRWALVGVEVTRRGEGTVRLVRRRRVLLLLHASGTVVRVEEEEQEAAAGGAKRGRRATEEEQPREVVEVSKDIPTHGCQAWTRTHASDLDGGGYGSSGRPVSSAWLHGSGPCSWAAEEEQARLSTPSPALLPSSRPHPGRLVETAGLQQRRRKEKRRRRTRSCCGRGSWIWRKRRRRPPCSPR